MPSRVTPCTISNERFLKQLEGLQEFKIVAYNLNNIRYSDDTVLMTNSEKKPKRSRDMAFILDI